MVGLVRRGPCCVRLTSLLIEYQPGVAEETTKGGIFKNMERVASIRDGQQARREFAMNRLRSVLVLALCFMPAMPCAVANGDMEEVTKLLRIIPADFPVTIVVANLARLDGAVLSAYKRFEPDSAEPWLVAGIKRDFPIGKWIDFGKPMALALPNIGGQKEVVFWVSVAGFAEKVKSVDGAKKEEGVWEIPFEGEETVFAKARGAYVVAATSKETLSRAVREGKTLADELRLRMNLLEKRDALIHVNADSIRPMALGAIAQAAQMVPMFAMMASQQSGTDATVTTTMFATLLDSAKKFVEQIAFVELSVAVGDKAIDLTIATGYNEGAIKTYLAKQKPASIPLLTQIEKQPYFMAAAYHVPGDEPGFLEYLFDQINSAIPTAPMTGQSTVLPGNPAGGGGQGTIVDQTKATKEALRVARDLYRNIKASNMVMGMSPGGMRMSGDYYGKDPKAILELTKRSMTAANPLVQQFGGGARYEALGPRKLGDISVEVFTMKLDTTNPSAAVMANMYGENSRLALGATDDRVRFCMGNESYMKRFFTTTSIEKPFAAGRLVAEALAALPAKRNAVVLIDPAGLLPLVGPYLGIPKVDAVPPGPPVAISVSLAGEPARLDIHVPLRSIERLMQALEPDDPM